MDKNDSAFTNTPPSTTPNVWILRKGMEWNLSIANSLIFIYSNNGRLDIAKWLFDEMPERDLVSWNSIILAHYKQPEALVYFQHMLTTNTSPDAITFVSLLSCCAHSGNVKDGERFFSMMRGKYGINPTMEHYACMVNLYGRAGLIDKAYNVITGKMSSEACLTVSGALLYACYLHGNVDVREVVAKRLLELEPDNEHNFKLLMRIYEKEGRSDDVMRIKGMIFD